MTHTNKNKTCESFAASIKETMPPAEHQTFEPFGDIPIDERWRPAGCETDPLIRELWNKMSDTFKWNYFWDRHRKINPRTNKSAFDFK